MKTFWIVGRVVKETPGGRVWEFQGLFADLALAVAQCDDSCFIGPAFADEVLPANSITWDGAFYPTLEPEKLRSLQS